ncbi:MAG: Ig-like domain-containing protein [Desulfobulbia bacterium]
MTTDAPANNPPTANNFTYGTDIDNAAKTFDWKALSAAADVDGNPLTAAVQVQGTKGTFVIAGDNVTYTPAAAQAGSDTGTLRISDGQGGTKDIVVTVNNIDTLAPNTPTGGPTLAAVGGVYYSKLATSNITVNSATGGRLWINGVDSGVDI